MLFHFFAEANCLVGYNSLFHFCMCFDCYFAYLHKCNAPSLKASFISLGRKKKQSKKQPDCVCVFYCVLKNLCRMYQMQSNGKRHMRHIVCAELLFALFRENGTKYKHNTQSYNNRYIVFAFVGVVFVGAHPHLWLFTLLIIRHCYYCSQCLFRSGIRHTFCYGVRGPEILCFAVFPFKALSPHQYKCVVCVLLKIRAPLFHCVKSTKHDSIKVKPAFFICFRFFRRFPALNA